MLTGIPKDPPGLRIAYKASSGTYSVEGTPTEAGEYVMTWRVTDATGEQANLAPA